MQTHYLPKDARAFLREELQIRKKRRPHYSLRAFARDLEMSPSSLCEFLAGRQGMSRERIIWISKKINLSDEQIVHFCDLVESKFGRTPRERKQAKVRVTARSQEDDNRLSLEKFHFIADWYHLTLLEVLSLPEANFSIKDLAGILSIEEKQVREALKRLEKLNLVKKNQSKYEITTEATVAGDEGPNRAVQIYHEQFLRMQADQVFKKPVQERENISASLTIANEDWPAFREDLKKSIIDLLTHYTSKNSQKNQVMAFTLQAITLLPTQPSVLSTKTKEAFNIEGVKTEGVSIEGKQNENQSAYNQNIESLNEETNVQ